MVAVTWLVAVVFRTVSDGQSPRWQRCCFPVPDWIGDQALLESISVSVEASSANNLAEIRVIKDTTLGGSPSYTDIKMTCTLGYDEPADQDLFDSSTTNEGDYIFDEMAIFSYPSDPSNQVPINTSTMLTHVIFLPVQKSQHRIIEIIYTIRIQLS